MFFNKAISTIDNIIKKLIHELLKSRGKSRIILIIVYCLNIVKRINKIIFLKKGEVKERGSHTKLLNRRGLYYEIWIAIDNMDGMEGVRS